MDNPLVQPDPGLFFWTIAVFLVLLYLLKRFAWGPLLAARADADGIVSEARADGAKLREDLRRQAQQEAQGILQNAERQIQQERDRALQQIRQEAVDMSLMIVSMLIRRNLTAEDNASLIDEALQQVQPPPQD